MNASGIGRSPEPPKPKVMLGKPFILALMEAGIVPERCTHVVLEAQVDSVVQVHYSVLGDDRLVKVIPSAAARARLVEEQADPDR